MKKSALRFAALLCAFALLTGCGNTGSPETSPVQNGQTGNSAGQTVVIQPGDMFTSRDLNDSYDPEKAAHIQLNGTSATADSNAVQISGSTVTITDEGTYILSGTLTNGRIVVNAEKTDKTQLVFSGVSVHSETSAPVYVLQADKVFITLAPGSSNRLSNGGSFVAVDENNIDAVIYSKEDLTLNGTGSLTVSSPAGHGIVSKDDLVITGGVYTVTCAGHGVDGKDSVRIAGAALTVDAGKDGIHGENDEDASLGFVYMQSGSVTIAAEGDGISAGNTLQIDGGSVSVITGGGSVNAPEHSSGGIGGMGGMPGGRPRASTSTETGESQKGLKAGEDLVLGGGSFTLDTVDDGIHANGNITVNSGTLTISTGDDGFHADELLTIQDGNIRILKSYEGLEGNAIHISGGDIRLVSADDGLNAAGGTDQSGFGGPYGGDRFGSGSLDSHIEISGGTLYINASGDGIDANGTLNISGGHVTVCGPTQGDTAVLDYDRTGTITGGTFIGTGSYMMAQTLSSTQQGVIALSVGNRSAGTLITLKDSAGNTLFSCTPEMPFAIVILSSPEMVKGETYHITIGEDSGSFEAY